MPVTQNSHRPLFSIVLAAALLLVSTPSESGTLLFQSNGLRTNDYSGQGTPYSPQQLQPMVAPIALYPDPMVALILTGATYPDQIVAAADYVHQHEAEHGNELMLSVAAQPWDPSVKALAEFPGVLSDMSRNLVWTSELGEAYHNQPSDVMTAIQSLRAKAMAAGNLKSSSQLKISQPTPDIITIMPANAQVVYLPVFSAAVVYGAPVATPNYTSSETAQGALSFGPGIAVGALTAGSCCDWGWSAWNANWYHGGVEYHDLAFNGNNAWQGAYYGGFNYYGYHTYHTRFDLSHPYNAFQGFAKDNTAPTPDVMGAAGKVMIRTTAAVNPFDASSGGWANTEELRGWGQSDTGGLSTAFAAWGNHPGSSGLGSTGWGERASSFRGWMTHGGSGGGWGTGGRLVETH